tara:strand:- start:16357 stop:16647 length:291 start_codon:yes stop_codon:yes gene_type:complete
MSAWAYRIAQQEYGRLIRQGMGIFLIAEAWDIEPMYLAHQDQMNADRVWVALPNHVRGRGLLTEPYLLGQMAQQIIEMYEKTENLVFIDKKRRAVS